MRRIIESPFRPGSLESERLKMMIEERHKVKEHDPTRFTRVKVQISNVIRRYGSVISAVWNLVCIFIIGPYILLWSAGLLPLRREQDSWIILLGLDDICGSIYPSWVVFVGYLHHTYLFHPPNRQWIISDFPNPIPPIKSSKQTVNGPHISLNRDKKYLHNQDFPRTSTTLNPPRSRDRQLSKPIDHCDRSAPQPPSTYPHHRVLHRTQLPQTAIHRKCVDYGDRSVLPSIFHQTTLSKKICT